MTRTDPRSYHCGWIDHTAHTR